MTSLADAESLLSELGPVPFPLPLGALAPIVEGGFTGMRKGEWIVAGPRERIGAVLRGCPPERLVHAHAGARPYKVAASSSAPGSRALHAVGLSMAEKAPVLCFLGLASAANGAFAEALNVACLVGAPVLFVVAVARIGDDAPVGRQLATTPGALAEAFRIPVVRLAAPDATAVAKAVRKARGTLTLIEVTLE